MVVERDSKKITVEITLQAQTQTIKPVIHWLFS